MGAVHLPRGEKTACGIRLIVPSIGTFHSQECLDGDQLCIGIHVLAVDVVKNPLAVTCPICIRRMRE